MGDSRPIDPIAERIRRNQRRIEGAGLTLERRGRCWRITGPGVDVLLASLEHLSAADLVPVRYQDLPG